MVNNSPTEAIFVLHERGFHLSAYCNHSSALKWCEFMIIVNSSEDLGCIGGLTIEDFLSNFFKVAEKERGKKLSLIQDAPFKDLVGGHETEYLGYIVFSEYKTLYFFRKKSGDEHVVLADPGGNLLAHQELGIGTLLRWKKSLMNL